MGVCTQGRWLSDVKVVLLPDDASPSTPMCTNTLTHTETASPALLLWKKWAYLYLLVARPVGPAIPLEACDQKDEESEEQSEGKEGEEVVEAREREVQKCWDGW